MARLYIYRRRHYTVGCVERPCVCVCVHGWVTAVHWNATLVHQITSCLINVNCSALLRAVKYLDVVERDARIRQIDFRLNRSVRPERIDIMARFSTGIWFAVAACMLRTAYNTVRESFAVRRQHAVGKFSQVFTRDSSDRSRRRSPRVDTLLVWIAR